MLATAMVLVVVMVVVYYSFYTMRLSDDHRVGPDAPVSLFISSTRTNQTNPPMPLSEHLRIRLQREKKKKEIEKKSKRKKKERQERNENKNQSSTYLQKSGRGRCSALIPPILAALSSPDSSCSHDDPSPRARAFISCSASKHSLLVLGCVGRTGV